VINRAWFLAPVLIAAAACGSSDGTAGQSTQVTMGQGTCTVYPTALHAVTTTFTVRNTTAKSLTFLITEDEGTNEVGRLDVEPGSMKPLQVHLDAADKYQTKCGATPGPEIEPQG
jgi:hypothetical protein